ncbi:MAG: carotenoid biosynthesis protein [Methyloceanibacter sp.]|uniref:carotenoid biosynthesis protein n=1 Tax=Methyloceanibacter sp. TaxID=1965321 RepID=UPI001D41B1D7|nr:carotenoid biosynthesis protein [Methyloceanibacter sp.]MCB1441408.1 carotenoid biosynthesis protein [Methyloceanibacter sp.]
MSRLVHSPPIVSLYLVAAAWVGNALYALGEPGGALKYWSPALVAVAMIAFVVLHGRLFESTRGLLLFVATVFVIGWGFESISIMTGIPFGNYHYTDAMAPFLGHVPVSVMPAYCLMGYVSWAMARILVLQQDDCDTPSGKVLVPLVAALLMVLWDLSMDPLRATVEQRWIWHDGGRHLGVPLLNYLGWFLVTWTMFQTYALLRQPAPVPCTDLDAADTSLLRLSVPLMYLAFPVEYLLNAVVADPDHAAVFVESAQLDIGEIYAATALLSLVTMVPAALIASHKIWRVEMAPLNLALNEETQR